jgi:hypothetical protein
LVTYGYREKTDVILSGHASIVCVSMELHVAIHLHDVLKRALRHLFQGSQAMSTADNIDLQAL